MINCVVCAKEIDDKNGTDKWAGIMCEADCGRHFCSLKCADLDHYENTFPNCCPGIYWCGLCKKEYLDAAKGHLFMIAHHDPHPNLQAYLDRDPKEPLFVDRCMSCDIWYYEFKSQTDEPGKYEGYACEAWLEDIN